MSPTRLVSTSYHEPLALNPPAEKSLNRANPSFTTSIVSASTIW
ncbi:MAG: hypothetical protein JWR19_3332 [Pedosphaera sp.]|nr:hypothetical protein [Pedosphaera sp.]